MVEQSSISLARANARFFARKPFPTGQNEISRCPICKGTKYEDDLLGGDTHWRLCQTCGSAYKDNFPTDEEIKEFYINDYRLYEQAGTEPYPRPAHFRTHVLRSTRQFALIMNVVKHHKVYLDYGCGLGWSLVVAKFLGLEPYGVELGGVDRIWAKENYDIDLYESLEDLPRNDFDLVVMSHVLEHFIDPIGRLTTLYKEYMSPDSRLVIEVPSMSTPSAWSAFHAVAFNTNSLGFTLKEAGFEVELIRSKDTDKQYPPNLMWIVGRKSDGSTVDEHPEVGDSPSPKHP